MKSIESISVCGLGKLGGCIAATYAARGFPVIGIDVDPIAILISKVQTQKYTERWLKTFLTETLTQLSVLEEELTAAVPNLRFT